MEVDRDFAYRVEAALARRRTAVRAVPLAYRALVKAQTSPRALQRFSRSLLKSPTRFAAYLRTGPDPILFAALAGPRSLDNLSGVHTFDRSALTPMERYAGKVAAAHLDLCRRDPAKAAAREARWAGQRRLLRSGFLRSGVDAAASTYGAATKAVIDAGQGRRALVVPPRSWRPVGVFGKLPVPRLDVQRQGAIVEHHPVERAAEPDRDRSGFIRRRFLFARGSARAEQMHARSRVRVPLSSAIYRFRLKRALARGLDSTVRFLQRVANNPRRMAAAIRSGTDPLIVAAAIGPRQVEKLLTGKGFDAKTPLGRFGKVLQDQALSGQVPKSRDRALGKDPTYAMERNSFVANQIGVEPYTVRLAWSAFDNSVRDPTPEAGRRRQETVGTLVKEMHDKAGSRRGDEEWWGEESYDDADKRAPEDRRRRDEDRGGGGGGEPDQDDRDQPDDDDHGRGAGGPDPASGRWKEHDLGGGHRVVTFSASDKGFARHQDDPNRRLTSSFVLAVSTEPPAGGLDVMGDAADKFSSVRMGSNDESGNPSVAITVVPGAVLDEHDRKVAFEIASLAQAMERDRKLYPRPAEGQDWRPPRVDSHEKGVVYSPEAAEKLREDRAGLVQRFSDYCSGQSEPRPKLTADTAGGFTVYGHPEIASVQPTAEGGWRLVPHSGVELDSTGLDESTGAPAFVAEADQNRFDRAYQAPEPAKAAVELDDVVSGRDFGQVPFDAQGRQFSAETETALRAWMNEQPDSVKRAPPQFATRAEAQSAACRVSPDDPGIKGTVTRQVPGDPPWVVTSEVILHHVPSEVRPMEGAPVGQPFKGRAVDPEAAKLQPADLKFAYRAETGKNAPAPSGRQGLAEQNSQILSRLVSSRMAAAQGEGGDQKKVDWLVVRAAVVDVAAKMRVPVRFPKPSEDNQQQWQERFGTAPGRQEVQSKVAELSKQTVERVSQAREERVRDTTGPDR